MLKLKAFIWFTRHSNQYMASQKIRMIVGFWPAWRLFWRLTQEEAKRG